MDKLTEAEWQALIKYASKKDPLLADAAIKVAGAVYVAIQKANGLALDKYRGKDASGNNLEIHNGRGDALKHCYLSALLYKEFGEELATDFMNAHEKVTSYPYFPSTTFGRIFGPIPFKLRAKNPLDEKEMDLFNNALGRQIAAENQNVTTEQLAELCATAVATSKAKVLSGPAKNMLTTAETNPQIHENPGHYVTPIAKHARRRAFDVWHATRPQPPMRPFIPPINQPARPAYVPPPAHHAAPPPINQPLKPAYIPPPPVAPGLVNQPPNPAYVPPPPPIVPPTFPPPVQPSPAPFPAVINLPPNQPVNLPPPPPPPPQPPCPPMPPGAQCV